MRRYAAVGRAWSTAFRASTCCRDRLAFTDALGLLELRLDRHLCNLGGPLSVFSIVFVLECQTLPPSPPPPGAHKRTHLPIFPALSGSHLGNGSLSRVMECWGKHLQGRFLVQDSQDFGLVSLRRIPKLKMCNLNTRFQTF